MWQVTLPGNIVQTITYDQNGRQTSIKAVRGSTVLTDYTGSYTNAAGKDTGLLQTEKDNLKGLTTKYTYDGLNRLISATQTGNGSNSYTYEYDQTGNMTKSTRNGVVSPTYGYNAANQQTTVNGVVKSAYDAAGNHTKTLDGLGMTYNKNNQTTKFTLPNGTTVSADYEGLDQTKRTKIGDTKQANGQLGLYSDTTDRVTTYYAHMPNGANQVVSQTTNKVPHYYLMDLRGSIVALTDANGIVANTYSYDPYGNILNSTGTVANPWRFVGGYYDKQTNLYKFGTRYYNPADGRWTQLDPSGKEYGYVYAQANPVNYTDPTGYFTQEEFSKGAGIIAGGSAVCAGVAAVVGAAPVAFGCTVAGGLFGIAAAATQ
jgi:RHS repeat-associated protein